jgi:hypothetical protein
MINYVEITNILVCFSTILPEMIIQWIKFRLRQAQRMIQASGIGLLLIALLVTVGLSASLINWLFSAPPLWIGAVSLAAGGYVHLSRDDGRFLHQVRFPIWIICLVDYAMGGLLIALFPLSQGHFITALSAFTGIIWAFLPIRIHRDSQSEAKIKLTWLPSSAFEWRYNIRTQWAGWLLMAFPLLMATFLHWAFFMAFLCVVFMLLPAGYDHFESAAQFPANRQLAIQRWRKQTPLLYGIMVPAAIWLAFTQPAWWWLGLYGLVATELLLLLCTAYKWYVWAPDRRRIINGNIVSTGVLGLIVPGGIIGTAGLALYYFIRSKKTFR